jgi:putative membrane protein insertion efficiency factor
VSWPRRAAWAAGAPLRGLLLALIGVYRVTLAGVVGGQCRFYPSCSRYAEEAIRTHGAARGAALAAWRVARCGPFTLGGVDHVPRRLGHASTAASPSSPEPA